MQGHYSLRAFQSYQDQDAVVQHGLGDVTPTHRTIAFKRNQEWGVGQHGLGGTHCMLAF